MSERHHYEGDDCNPPHVILPPELSAEHAELLGGRPRAGTIVPLTAEQAGWPPPYKPGLDSLNGILNALQLVDAHLDDAGPQWAKDCPEANMARRVGKAQLEAAEAMEELSLLTGENPRKGRHPEARERMLAELGDTAVAALLGIQSQAKDTAVTWQVFLAALDKAHDRVLRHAGQMVVTDGDPGEERTVYGNGIAEPVERTGPGMSGLTPDDNGRRLP